MSGLATAFVLIVLGVLAASSSIVARRPDAQVYVDRLVPYQGCIGFAACFWGIWIIFKAILHLNWLIYLPLWWLTYAGAGALIAALGLLLGYALLTRFILSRNAEAVRRGAQLRLGIGSYQVALGYAAIALGIWTILAMFLL